MNDGEIIEHGVRQTDGSMIVWNNDLEEVYPLADRIEHGQRHGGTVYRRRVIVVTGWEKVPK